MVTANADAAYNLARWILRDPTDAEDAVQEAAIRAFRSIGTLRDGAGRSWFLAIVRNCSLNLLRSRRLGREVSLECAEETPDAGRAIDDMAILRADGAAIRRTIEMLPVEQREVIVLREIEEFGYEEIAKILDVPVGTVMSRLSRARKRVAALLEPVKP